LIVARHTIFVLDDDPGTRFGVRSFLQAEGFEVLDAETVAGARELLATSRPDLAIIDYVLPDGNALDLLPTLTETTPAIPAVVLTGHGSIDLAVQAMKQGAEHFLTKPVALPSLLVLVQRILETRRAQQGLLAERSRRTQNGVDPFLGESPAITRLRDEVLRLAETDRPVLLQGETGTGKSLLARWLHHEGPRSEETLVDLNCASLPREMLEAEIFGYEKGAFTGAVARKAGLVEMAHRGTLFLDEIGDLALELQPKLLKVLEEGRFRRLGAVRDQLVDVRLVAASHCDLASATRTGRFRSDLYFRISTMPVVVPALRDRFEDIPLIARRLLDDLSQELRAGQIDLEPDAVEALQAYRWPGNIRELRNVLERAVLLSDRNRLRAKDLRFGSLDAPTPAYENLKLVDMERAHIERVLHLQDGHVGKAAEVLGIPRSSLYVKLKRLNIDPSKI
jgi:DNA-binding NtrC family response regulator